MKKMNKKIGLLIGLLILSTISSCVQIRQKMGRPTLGNATRSYNKHKKKYIIGGFCAGLLTTSGIATWSFWPSYSQPSGIQHENSTGLTPTTPYLSSTTFRPSIPGVSNATEWDSSTTFTPTTPYELSTAYSSSTTEVSTEMEASSTISMGTTPAYNSSTEEARSTFPITPSTTERESSSSIGTTSTTEKNQKKSCYHVTIDMLQYVQCLIHYKEDLNEQYDWKETTILMEAAKQGRRDVVELLIKNGANKDIKDISNQTALIHAIICSSPDIAKLLIHENADLNIKDTNRNTALTYARERGYIDVVELLKQKGAIDQ
ncbi:ankyrin repeat domain-containing protein [Candidatus Cardinium hertigii]|uniref:ankyrin repeat domain-containing protein n=1 Tax=Candidatus Cardinium hertigii TaxID=247481 RepID=UPI003D7EDC68